VIGPYPYAGLILFSLPFDLIILSRAIRASFAGAIGGHFSSPILK
jgi:hypothetical protein